MKIERDKTTVVLEGNDEHRAIRLALALACYAVEDAQRRGKVPDALIRAGADPSSLHDLVHLREHMDGLHESI